MADDKKVQVTYMGKTYQIEPRDYDDLVAQVFKRLERYLKALIDNNAHNQKVYREYLETAKIRNGFFDAVTQAVVIRAGNVKYPNDALASASLKATVNLARAQSSQDLKLLKVVLPQAEQAISRFSADVMRFLGEFTGSAGAVATVLQVTSSVSFAVVGALATPMLVPAAGVAGAGVVVSGGLGVLKSAANELGNAASGQKVDLWESVKTVAWDGTIEVAMAGVASKIPLGFVEKMAKGLAGRLASKVPGLAAPQLQKLITNFLTGTGEETIKSAVAESIGVLGKMAKSGKAPSRADFEEAVMKVVGTALTAGLLKNLASFQKKWAMDSRDLLEGQLFPDALKSVMKGRNQLPPVIKAKVWAEVWAKMSEEVAKAGMAPVVEAGKTAVEESKMLAAARAAVLKDPRIRKLMEAEVEKSLKKNKLLSGGTTMA